MAQGYSSELVGVLDGTQAPAKKADGRVYQAKPRRFRASFNLAASTTAKAIGDTNVIAEIPEGYSFSHATLVATVGLAAATIAIGTVAVPDKYLAAVTVPTADTSVSGGKAAARAAEPLAIKDVVIMTIGAAALPNAGTLVIDLFATGR
jgi:uncharacterized membrane protein YkgB